MAQRTQRFSRRCISVLSVKPLRALWLFALTVILYSAEINAQSLDEFQTRTRVGIQYRPKSSRWVFTPKLFFYTNGNGLDFWRTMAGLEVNYKVTKWLRLGTEYRFATSHTRDFHRMRGFLLLDYKLAKKWEVEWRPMFQRDLTYFDTDVWERYPPRDLLRNLVALNYSPRKRTNYFVAAELYSRFEPDGLNAYRLRPSVGAQRVFKKRHVFGAELFYIRDFARPGDAPEDRARLALSYTWRLGKPAGGKKGKPEEDLGTEMIR